jgi:tricorn protease
MNPRSLQLRPTILALCVLASSLPAPAAASEGEVRLFRYPAIHRDFAVFVYAGDIWRVPTAGGRAWRLTAHEGVELTPKISPDGEWVAYSAEYTGTRQVYVMPAGGGAPRQLTFYNDAGIMPPRGGFDYWIQGWRPDGKILVRMNRTPWGERPGRYFVVDPAGGLEQPLPIELGGSATYSPDGGHLAYTYFDREFRTWKRYQGGRNQDIWTFDLSAMKSRRLTTWAGSDNFPMWHGDTIYYTSDRDHTQNIFAIDLPSGEIRKVTSIDEYDVLWPSLGPDAIIFTSGGALYRLDLASEEVEKIAVEISGDLPQAAVRWEAVDDNITTRDVSPDGKRAVFEARGDLFTVPAKDGATRNLTDTQGVRESAPAWSPDGRRLAYWSDASGEMELYLRDLKPEAEPVLRQVTHGGGVWRYPPVWSPDGRKLAFGDSDHHLQVLDVESGRITTADTNPQGDIDTYRWSPDSLWLAYEQSHPESELPCLALYSLESGQRTILGDGLTFDFEPTFSADGKHLFFLSNRDYNLKFSDFEFNFIYDNSTRVFAAALDPTAEALFPVKSDEVEIQEEDEPASGKSDAEARKRGKAKDKEEPAEEKKAAPRVRVVAEGFVARTVALPGVEAGNYVDLAAVEGAVLYRHFNGDEPPRLMRYEIADREAKEVASGVAEYALAARGEKVLYRSGSDWTISDAKPGASGDKLELSGLRMKLDPRAEWRQMFEEAWRIGRDWFYDENMHGLDWPAMRERYGALVPSVAHRSDLDFLLGELAAELEAGHAYVQRGEEPAVKRIEGGMLGAEFAADPSGRYRIAKIFPGENWDEGWRSPLTEPGVGVSEGEFLLAIDGVDLTTADNPYRLLEGKGDQAVALEVNSRPSAEGARTVTARTITSERNLRYLDWVRTKAALVERLSDGRIGYVHLPDTAGDGNRALQKYFYSQSAKPALIVDDRYNGGGFIPDRMIEMLSRNTMSYWARRGLEAFSTPGFAHDGPKAMLINGMASSGGDALPFYFRQASLGPLVGTRTWGGLIGISGNPQLVDGGGILYPTFRFFTPEGEWAVEGVGVAPDYEVWDLPEAIASGGDPSIEKAVELLLAALDGTPTEPVSPKAPDRSGD